MEDNDTNVKRWEDMEIDILVKIFQSFNVIELTSGIYQVCSSWRLACCDPVLWRTLDLSLLKSNFIKIPIQPYVWVDYRSYVKLDQVLKVALRLSHGNVNCLIFHFNLYLKNDHLIYIAERCPRLKRLVLPAWNLLTKGVICKAFHIWKDLESMTMPSVSYFPDVMEEIGMNCTNFTELKIMGPCDTLFASTIATFLPNLKVLSLRCSVLFKEALIIILDCLKHLEVLNISHCLLVEVPPSPAPRRVLRELDESTLEKSLRLRKFFTCWEDSCIMCQRTIKDEGLLRWYKYEEGLWQTDEICSLSH